VSGTARAVPAAARSGLPPALLLRPGVVLPVARYRFTFRMADELFLPEYAGSLLRGQFGAALRRIVCMTGLPECAPCPLFRTCPYPSLFEAPAPSAHALQRFSEVPNPYVVEPPPLGSRYVPAGGTVSFCLVLVGRALDRLPLIAYALQRAFGRGIGRHEAKGRLEEVAIERPGAAQSLWDRERSRLCPHDQTLAMPLLPQVGAVTLHIATPLRLQNQGHPIPPDRLRPRTLFTALLRRTALLFELHAALPGFADDAARLAACADRLSDERRLAWKDWTRFSSRQRREMTLGGAIGAWTLAGEPEDVKELLPWFWLGQWLHVGKNTTMGMGMYSLT
jgi:hypothetical protein